MKTKADIGLIGLAVMGENLVLNMESKGFTVAVYNRTVEKVDKFMNGRGKDKKFIGAQSVEEFIADIDVWQEDTLVVGHLPFMARLVSRLVTGEMERECVRYTPGSIVCLEREAPEQWVLAWMLRPELQGSETRA